VPGLYVHVPFCEKKCLYCDFYSIETQGSFQNFVECCVREIHNRGATLQTTIPFTSIFFGGGTPSLLDPMQIGEILTALHASFLVAPDAECSVECNPGTVTPEKLHGYRSIGINRLSFGVQSFHELDLRFLSRIHTASEAVQAIRMAHEADFDNVNLDLMFSLPGQTRERWMENLRRARDLGTSHVSCYSLTVEKGTPLAVLVEGNRVTMPHEDSDAELFEATMEALEGWGYLHYEVSNYAHRGFECRHNLTYWRHDDYLGFGPSAHSTWQGKRTWNVSSLQRYLEAIHGGMSAKAGGEKLLPSMLRNEYIYLRLRSEGIDLEDFHQRFASDLRMDNQLLIDEAFEQGLLVENHGVLRLTRKGFLVCDELCVELK